MIAAITAILGALSSFVPGILQYFTMKASNAQQLALQQLQMQAAKEGTALQIDLANSQSDIQQQQRIYTFAGAPSGVKWVDALTVSIRPYITIIMFHVWIAVEIALLYHGIQKAYDLAQLAALVWTPDTQAIFGAIIGFWFGNRMLTRGSQAMAATLAVSAPPAKVTVAAPARHPAASPPPFDRNTVSSG